MEHAMHRLLFAVLFLSFAVVSRPQSQPPARPLWGDLEPGPPAVGFTSSFDLDPSRRYQMTFASGQKYADEPGPRPILVNVWYPAAEDAEVDAEPMPHGGYLELSASDDERLARFAAAL